MSSSLESPSGSATTTTTGTTPLRQHGVKGVYYGGDWLDIEDAHYAACFGNVEGGTDCSGCDDFKEPCPRSASRNAVPANNANASSTTAAAAVVYDVVIVGAGCIGAAIARALAQYQLRVLWLEAADDVSQGATKGNSGIVHAGYDDEPGTNRAKFCWKGNQMFAQLDKELRFGYQKNGSLVVALNEEDRKHLIELKQRGETNGVQRLRIVEQEELRTMEPAINPEAIAALYSPDAGNVIPYEYTIALAENAVDNGVELRIRRQLMQVNILDNGIFELEVDHWEPQEYVQAISNSGKASLFKVGLSICAGLVFAHWLTVTMSPEGPSGGHLHIITLAALWLVAKMEKTLAPGFAPSVSKSTPITDLVKQAGEPEGKHPAEKVAVEDMLVGGSGSENVMKGVVIEREKIKCRFVINCAGGAADKVAGMIGDKSFKIKPRLGDYLLLNRSQGYLARHTLFPCPDPVLGKGVLVQTTLWGNLILGPTARDIHNKDARDMTDAEIQEYILSKCKRLVSNFDPKETIHAFCGARAKSDRGDWIIEPSKQNPNFINVAGIDSPGLAGSPAIALEVVEILKKAGLDAPSNTAFKRNRAPIIIPKVGMKGLKMGPVGKFDSDGSNTQQMAQNVICKCEKVTELEVVRAMRRSLPIDSSQGIRKRTRAGMGHCQGDPDNYGCEARVRAIIARENGVAIEQVGRRPWPATSTLSQRWIDDEEKRRLTDRMMKD